MKLLATLATAIVAGSVLMTGDAVGTAPAEPGAEPAALASLGRAATFTTVFPAPLAVEGLTGDRSGNLYSAARGGDPFCPVWRISSSGGDPVVVGNIPAPCNPAGIAFDARGRLYVADSGRVHVFTPDAANPPTSTVFAAGVPGSNGLAFDRAGALWVSDGGTGQGRVWRVGSDGVPTEVFRVQPMVSDVNVANGVGGVGRDVRGLPPGQVTITDNGRAAADTAGSQHLVANGLAFTRDGTLLVADTARGAIWRVTFDRRGALRSPTGCDTTFTPNTLCLTNILVVHPYLDGADGIALDRAGNIWTTANERNAIVVVTPHGQAVEVFRNAPDAGTRLRNTGPMEFPTSPFLTGNRLCVTHSDGARRDNFPNSAGEASPTGAVRAKISCLDARLPVPGLPLPVS
ncbi:MAG TPA: SMP-30/gluconolactonase/LRE family protein [Actinophytocola sp.]|uniref:SMP-30/gluconolactonase/LRE family protein n=1 Tax=Actinophytocola sp. TaxID=1872138 RepID=UPI002DB6C528|nr:SMP-30/gluconolactonase/LRE family protein [Actinophytocola sp.]HEU5470823.1 SMP-30/gluconolactonase/LRE family protein [Actinophytocola sp.]